MPHAKDKAGPKPREASPLWPSATEASSGLRDRREDLAQVPSPGGGTAPYRLLSPLGSTAYGRAYRAVHEEQGREVVLHFLAVVDDPEGSFASALPLAVAKCAQLSHPNVIAVEAHGRDSETGDYFLVTGPLEGVSLADQLADLGVLPLRRALQLGLQIGRALRAAHKLGIVHGALTPANVRLLASERGELARVVGFGSQIFSARPRSSAPSEQLLGEGAASEGEPGLAAAAQVDVHALGALLARMLKGESPSAGPSAAQPIPRELDELIAQSLSPEPAQRPADVTLLMRSLREIARKLDLFDAPDLPSFEASTSSAPPSDAGSGEGEPGGGLFSGDGSTRRSAVWVCIGLVVALLAVWLLWYASARIRPLAPPPAPLPAAAP